MPLTKKGTSRFLQTYGTLEVDKYGLSTATAIWHDHNETPTLPAIGAAHPLWSELKIEHISVQHQGSHWEIRGDHAGFFGTPEAVYELDASGTEEPIDTHPNFGTFAGSYGAEVNGAKFDEEYGEFIAFVSGTKRGVRGYICPGAIWRKTIVQSAPPSEGLGAVGTIVASPPGGVPSVPAGRTWLYLGMTYSQRGGAYTVRQEWKLSGRRGWDTDIYA